MFRGLLAKLEAIIEELEDAPEAGSDSEAFLRARLANALAKAARVLRVLANDEK